MSQRESTLKQAKRSVPRGHIIINQGDKKADAFYMIAVGRCTGFWVETRGRLHTTSQSCSYRKARIASKHCVTAIALTRMS